MIVISLLLAVSTGSTVFAIIVVIIIAVIAISATRKNEENTEQSPRYMQKEIPMSPETQALYVLGRQMVLNRDFDDAITVYTRLLELDPKFWPAAMMLGNLLFEKDKEASFAGLKIMERHFEAEGASFDDPALKDLALYFYMLGYHYNRHNSTDKANMFRNAAMNSRAFVKEYKSFRTKFAY